MNAATERAIFRWIHLFFCLPLLGLFYGNTDEAIQYADMFRYVIIPVLIVTGLWMWKGPAVRRLFSGKKSG